MRRVLDEDRATGLCSGLCCWVTAAGTWVRLRKPRACGRSFTNRDGTITLARFPKSVHRACYLRRLLLQFDRSGFGNTFSIKIVQSVLCKILRAWLSISTQRALAAITTNITIATIIITIVVNTCLNECSVLFFFFGLQKVRERGNAEKTERRKSKWKREDGRGSEAEKYGLSWKQSFYNQLYIT